MGKIIDRVRQRERDAWIRRFEARKTEVILATDWSAMGARLVKVEDPAPPKPSWLAAFRWTPWSKR